MVIQKLRIKHLMILQKNWLTDLSRRLKKAPARLYWKGRKIRCLRRRTNRFWIIRFNDIRNWRRKIIVICWRNWDGWFRSSRNLRAWEFRTRKRKLWSRICQRTKLEWVRITLCFWTRASLEFESVEETQKLETDTGIAGLK